MRRQGTQEVKMVIFLVQNGKKNDQMYPAPLILNAKPKNSLKQRRFKCHYENTPIQIYWKFHQQKLKIFR